MPDGLDFIGSLEDVDDEPDGGRSDRWPPRANGLSSRHIATRSGPAARFAAV